MAVLLKGDGVINDVGTGSLSFPSEAQTTGIRLNLEQNPSRETNPMAPAGY